MDGSSISIRSITLLHGAVRCIDVPLQSTSLDAGVLPGNLNSFLVTSHDGYIIAEGYSIKVPELLQR
jgi:hypothetical protein